MSEQLYVDGGVIGRNPSSIGGTWAWCLVVNGGRVKEGSGVILTADTELPTVSNNVAELYAAVAGLEAVGGCNFTGTVYSDSSITIGRIREGSSFNGIPKELRIRTLAVRRGRKYRTVLLAGHPTKKELVAGKAGRNGNPVSKWNVLCDEMCKRLAEANKQ